MKKTLALALTTSLFIAGCASTGSEKEPMAMEAGDSAIVQAEKDLAAAIDAQAQWKILDPATGGKAVSLSKLLKVAKKKAEEGNMDEANRIAERVSEISKISVTQSERYAGAMPYYQ